MALILDYPSWNLEMQIMTSGKAAENYRFDILDITKVCPQGDFPPIKIGKLVLNRNPTNYFAEVEQAAFSHANLVPEIGISPDKMLLARVFSYHDIHIHRLGPNYHLIPVNAPKHLPENNYQPDGLMRVDANGGQRAQLLGKSFWRSCPRPWFLEPLFEVSGLAAHTTILTPTMTLYSLATCTVAS